MRLSNVILRVSDLERAIEFWKDRVGLELNWSGGGFAFLNLGDVQLALNQPERFVPVEGETELVLEVDDVRGTHRAMSRRGVPFAVELRPVTSDGERELLAAHFRDPDGNLASVTGWVPAD